MRSYRVSCLINTETQLCTAEWRREKTEQSQVSCRVHSSDWVRLSYTILCLWGDGCVLLNMVASGREGASVRGNPESLRWRMEPGWVSVAVWRLAWLYDAVQGLWVERPVHSTRT